MVCLPIFHPCHLFPNYFGIFCYYLSSRCRFRWCHVFHSRVFSRPEQTKVSRRDICACTLLYSDCRSIRFHVHGASCSNTRAIKLYYKSLPVTRKRRSVDRKVTVESGIALATRHKLKRFHITKALWYDTHRRRSFTGHPHFYPQIPHENCCARSAMCSKVQGVGEIPKYHIE